MKRSVHTDALATLGTIISSDEKRDAIHLAVLPVQSADVHLQPGQDVGLLKSGHGSFAGQHIGIVDPFLQRPVKKGEWFWLVIYPRKITSLRHVWEHPSIPGDMDDEETAVAPTEEQLHQANLLLREEKAVAKERLRTFAKNIGLDYDELLEAARRYQNFGEYLCDGDRFEGIGIYIEFWDDYISVTGNKITEDRYDFFSCAC